MRKIYLKVSFQVVVNADDNVSIENITESLEVNNQNNSDFDIEDSTVENIEVIDSK